MKIFDLNFIENNLNFIISEMKKGKIFIYPTDTLYGIGCDATNSNSIQKIFDIKKRKKKPFLVIVPNFNWIEKNCIFDKNKFDNFKLPGPYSFILKIKNKSLISDKIISNNNTLGIRIPNCYFKKIIEKANIVFVSTSVNILGEKPILNLNEISKEILDKIDYIIKTDEKLIGKPSKIFDLTQNRIKQLR